DSETIRDKTWEAYKDDLSTRLKPNAWQVIIQTRWHEDDLSGRLLPEDYDGRSGPVMGTDGHEWFVVNLPMLAEHASDPIGRAPGQLLWPEWFNEDDVAKLRADTSRQRTWSALYQQRPTPDDGDYFKREWFRWYDTPPEHLRTYGASDYAVTAGGGDYTVHGVAGVDPDDNVYLLDVWRGQTQSDVWVDAFLDLVRQWRPLIWAEEQGQIIKSMDPIITKMMRDQRVYCRREQMASLTDKPSRSRSFQARAAQGKVYLPRNAPWVDVLMAELLAFPAGKNDDQVDVLGLLGRLVDDMTGGRLPKKEVRKPDLWERAERRSRMRETDQLSEKGF
ncbi:MAG: phage terminase large subunit, partial [Pseudomonadota bacterium]